MAQRKELVSARPAGRSRAPKRLPIQDEPSEEVLEGEILDGVGDGTATGSAPEEEFVILDGEVLDDEPAPSAPPSGSGATPPGGRGPGWRERTSEGARRFFGQKGREGVRARAEQFRQDSARAEDERPEMGSRERMLKLRSETRLAGEAYMRSLREAKIFVPGFDPDKGQRKLDAMQRVHIQMMMQSCMKPLSQGISAESVIQSVGMMMTMRMLSPEFKQETNHYRNRVKEQLEKRIDAKTLKRVDAAEKGIAQREQVFGGVKNDALRERLVGSTDARDHVGLRWRKRLERMERRERGDRELYTPETAAMTEVALMENAFWRMREVPASDQQKVYDGFRAMQARLQDQVEADGLDRAEVVKQARMIVGERIEHEPELRTVFESMAHGRVMKSAPETVRIAGTDKTHTVWTGGFDSHHGIRYTSEAMFTVRKPMDADTHQAIIGDTMKDAMMADMLRGDAKGDDRELGESMMGYAWAYAIHRDEVDMSRVPEGLRGRVEQGRTMLASMEVDGINDAEKQRIYSSAMVDAVEDMMAVRPDFTEKMMRTVGPNWEDKVQDMMDDPARAASGFEARPRPARRPRPSREQAFQDGPEQEQPQEGTGDRQP